jgi:hypothetical protein
VQKTGARLGQLATGTLPAMSPFARLLHHNTGVFLAALELLL